MWKEAVKAEFTEQMDIVYHPFILRGGVKPQRADSLSAG
jgi:hypothetical protein